MAEDRDHQPGKIPVSAHPAFPAIVGLWFAALLGLGTMVMPAVVLERIATATGFAAIFAPAEPPLSAAGRAVFALLATVLGLVGGLVLARRVASAQDAAARPTRRRTATGRSAPPRPLSVHEDLGEDAIAAPAEDHNPLIRGRRRALAVTDEALPSEFLMAAPLPGDADVPELSAEPELGLELAPELAENPMSERPSALEPHAAPLDLGELAPVQETPDEAPFVPAYVPELDTRKPRPIVAPSQPPVAETRVPVAAAPIVTAPIDGPLDGLGMVQLAERLGRSLQQREELRAAELEAQPGLQAEAEPLAFSAPSLDHEHEAIAVPPPVVPDALRAFMDDAPEDFAPPLACALEPDADVQVPPPVVPSALMPFAFEPFDDEDDDDLDHGSFTLPLSTMAPRAFDAPIPLEAEEGAEEGAEDEDDALSEIDESYSSLLEMNNPFRPREEFVRIDEPEADEDSVEPAVVFPSQEAPQAAVEAVEDAAEEPAAAAAAASPVPARPFDAPVRPRAVKDAAETERALRSALANLQRMSGAA